MQLDLVAEPENPYDERAVRIEMRGHHLGYIPRRRNRAISRMLREGADLQCWVTRVRPESDPWKALGVAIKLEARKRRAA